jgi:hypothetical protein
VFPTKNRVRHIAVPLFPHVKTNHVVGVHVVGVRLLIITTITIIHVSRKFTMNTTVEKLLLVKVPPVLDFNSQK